MQALRVLTLLFLAALPTPLISGNGSARAAVEFSEWDAESLPRIALGAAQGQRLVLLVITQPDWCPPCIRLDRELLSNPDEKRFAELARDWLAIEIHGYDAPGAGILASHGIRFLGTPTTLLLAPEAESGRLGDARVMASVVGYPADYVEQLERAARGYEPVAAALERATTRGRPEDWLELARRYAARGDAEGARRAYRRLLEFPADAFPETGRDSLATLQARAEWELITEVQQRVEKDHAGTLAALDTWMAEHPEEASSEPVAWARAWALAGSGQIEAAIEVMEQGFLDSGSVDGVLELLYLAFRHPAPSLLERAEREGLEALKQFPAEEAALQAGLGRVYRRQGRLAEAETGFARAIELIEPEDPRYPIYAGQLEFVQKERAAR
jgi:tetratricopeptide (TPR) repeat protein